MKKNYFLLLTTVIFSTVMSFGQISIGPKVGLNFATITADSDASEGKGSATGLNAGAVINIGINDMFSIQPEILFNQKGVKYGFDILGVSAKTVIKESYLDIPVLAKVAFGGESVKGFVNAGPYLGYALSRSGYSEVDGEKTDMDSEDLEYDDDDSDGSKSNRLDLGLAFGAGVQFAAGPGNLFVEARYWLDFTDAVKYDETPDDYTATKNRVFAVSVGYLFTLGGE